MADGLRIAAVVLLMIVSLLLVFMWPPLAVLVVVAVAVYLTVGWYTPSKTLAVSGHSGSVNMPNTGVISVVDVPMIEVEDEYACIDDVENPEVITNRNRTRAWQVLNEEGDWRYPSEEQADGLTEVMNNMYDRALRFAPDDKYMVTEDPYASEIEPDFCDDVLETVRPRWDLE